MEGGGKRGHPLRDTSGSGVDELSQRNEQLLVGPDRGLRSQVRDPLEEAGSLMGGGGAGQDGVFEGLRGLRAQRAGCVGVRIAPRGVSREIAFPRAHLVYPACNELAQAHEGMGARRGWKGVIRGGWDSRPLGKEVFLSSQLEAGIGGDNPRNWGQVVCQVEGDWWERRDVVYEGDGHASQSRDSVVPVPRVLGLVRGTTPVEVEKEIRLGGNFPTRYQGSTVGREGGDGLREACCGRIYLRGGADEP